MPASRSSSASGGALDLLTWRAERRAPWSRFSLLSWNLLADCHVQPGWYPRVPPLDLDPAVRRPRLLAALQAMEADVMALQEVQPELLPELARRFPEHHLSHAAHGGEGLAVLVRGGAERVEARPLPGGRKQALLVELPGGHRLAVVHLTWTGDPPRTPRRGLLQLDAVLAWRPDLLCGDLNSLPGWPERQRLEAAGLVDRGPWAPTCNVGQRLQPLDAVAARPGWTVDLEPPPPIEAHTPMPSPCFPSDHLPVRARVQAPAP